MPLNGKEKVSLVLERQVMQPLLRQVLSTIC